MRIWRVRGVLLPFGRQRIRPIAKMIIIVYELVRQAPGIP
jgi:hypothetical protein